MAKSKKSGAKKAPAPSRHELIAEALDYRRQGYAYSEINEAMARTDAEALVNEGLSQLVRDPDRRAVLLELDRLNEIIKTVYSNAAGGDKEAISSYLALTARRDRLEEKIIPVDPSPAAAANTGVSPPYKGKGSKGGRPAHQPTDVSRKLVMSLLILGSTREEIAAQLEISEDTLDKHYAFDLKHGKQKWLAKVVGKLDSMIEAGKDSAVYFALKTQGGFREVDRGPAAPPPGQTGSGESTAMAETRLVVEIIGGLPSGSTAENPGGDNYSPIPPEERRG